MIVGAHVSVAGGLHNAVTNGTAIGADVLQIFVSPPQTFRVTAYSDEAIGQFKKLYQLAGFRALFLHAMTSVLALINSRAFMRMIQNRLLAVALIGMKILVPGTLVRPDFETFYVNRCFKINPLSSKC